jgi:hypothetical protein
MNLETISRKQLNDLEQQVRQLLITIKRAKLENNLLVENLQQLGHELEQVRCRRFDAVNSEYHTH